MARKKSKTPSYSHKMLEKSTNWYLILGILSLSLYGNTLFHGFTLDDAILITENIYTKAGFSGLIDIFTHDTFRGFFQVDGKEQLVSGGRYRPLSQAMFAVEYGIFGLSPLIGHLGNILLYISCVWSLFYVIKHFSFGHLTRGRSILFAGVVSVVFALHPVHTEVVANIKGRDEILVLIAGIWSLYFTAEYIRARSIKYAALSGAVFFGGMLSKENTACFLAVIPMTIYFFKSRNLLEIGRAMVPIVSSFALYAILRIWVLGFSIGGSPPLELMNNPFLKFVDGQYVHMSFLEKLPMIVGGLSKYIQLLVFPHPLTHDYYPKFMGDPTWSDLSVWGSAMLLIIIILVAISSYKRNRLLSFSIIYFFSTLFLTSNIVFSVGTHLSERFLFTPSVSLSLLAVLGLDWLAKRNGKWAWIVLGIVSVLMMIKTVTRNAVWKDNFTLMTTDVRTSYRSAKAQNAAGGELIAQAIKLQDTSQMNSQLQLAAMHLKEAIKIHPTYKNAYLLLGNAYYYLKRFPEAIEFFDYALHLDPAYTEALHNRGFAYRDLGRYAGEKQGDIARAVEYLEKAALVLQDDYETNRLLGVALGNQGKPNEAIEYFGKALLIRPDDAWTNYNLGLAYLAMKDSLNANQYISKAKALNPEVGK